VKIKFGGLLSKDGCSMLDHSTISWVVMKVLISLGRVFGGLRLPRS
jgi:hypothetical protein